MGRPRRPRLDHHQSRSGHPATRGPIGAGRGPRQTVPTTSSSNGTAMPPTRCPSASQICPAQHVARPLGRVVTNYVASRSDLAAVTNPTSRLLFPSRCAAQCYTQPRYGNAHTGSVSPNSTGRSRATREQLSPGLGTRGRRHDRLPLRTRRICCRPSRNNLETLRRRRPAGPTDLDSSNPDGGEYRQPTNPSGRSTTRPNALSASPDTDAC